MEPNQRYFRLQPNKYSSKFGEEDLRHIPRMQRQLSNREAVPDHWANITQTAYLLLICLLRNTCCASAEFFSNCWTGAVLKPDKGRCRKTRSYICVRSNDYIKSSQQ